MSLRSGFLIALSSCAIIAAAQTPFVSPTQFVCGVNDLSLLPAQQLAKVGPARTGARSVLVLRVDFADAPGASVSESEARAVLGDVSRFLQANSFQQLSLPTVAVTPVLRLPGNAGQYAPNNLGLLSSEARAAAAAAGFDFGAYDFAIYSFPASGFFFSAVAEPRGKGTWIHGNNFNAATVAHELGHNLGVMHANSWSTLDDSIIGPGRAGEYGNLFDVMGGSPFFPSSDFNANFRYVIGWLGDADVHLANTNGVYRVFTMDAAQPLDVARRFALRVPAQAPFNSTLYDYWIDARQALGYAWTANGIFIKAGKPDFNSAGNFLLDTTPGSLNGRLDSPLVVGRTFADFSRRVFITPIKKGSKDDHIYFDVQVYLAVTNNQSPALTVTASETNAAPLHSINFTAQAEDPDGDDVSYFWNFDDETLASKLNDATVSKAWSKPGRYVVQCTVSDMKGGSAIRSIIVQIGTSTNYAISGHVLAGSVPVPGVRVHNGRTPPDYRYTWTDNDGFYALTELAEGTHFVQAVQRGVYFPIQTVVVGPDAENIDLLALPLSAPFITAISPNHGLLGTSLTITGVNFSHASAVYFGDVPADFTVISPTQIRVVVPSGAATGHLVVITPDGSASSSNPFILDAGTPAIIVRPPQNVLVPQGADAHFAIELFGSGPLGYQWQHEGTNLPGATKATLAVNNTTLANEGRYSVVVTNPLGTVISPAATLVLLTLGRAVQQPELIWNTSTPAPWFSQTNVWLDTGDSAPDATTGDSGFEIGVGRGYSAQSSSLTNDSWIETTLAGPLLLTFSWQLSARFFEESVDFSIDGISQATLRGSKGWSQVSLPLTNGTHVLRWTRRAARIGTSAWLTQVRTNAAWFTTQPQNVTVLAGQAANLTATAGSPGAFQWMRQGIVIPGATNASLSFPSVTPAEDGDYRIIIDQGAARATSVVARLTVHPLVISQPPAAQDVSATSNAIFTVAFDSRAPVFFQWLFEKTPIPRATNQSLKFPALPANAGAYQVIVSNRYGAVTSPPAALLVRAVPPKLLDASNNYFAYVGENVSLRLAVSSVPPPTYRWSRNRRAIRGATTAVLSLPRIRLTQDGDYSLIAQNAFGAITQHVHVTVESLIISTQPQGQTVFVGDSLQLTVTAGSALPVRYQWRFNHVPVPGATNASFTIPFARLTNAGNYDVVVRRGRISATSSNAFVAVKGLPPLFDEEPLDKTSQLDELAYFTAHATGFPAPAYQWYFNFMPIAGATAASHSVHPVTSDWDGSFFVRASNEFGVATSRVARLTVPVGAPRPRISPNDFTALLGDCVILRATENTSPPATAYQWSFNGVDLPHATNRVFALPSITEAQAGRYRLTVTNALGFGISSNNRVEIRPALALDWWHWSAPRPRAADLHDATFGEGLFIAVGESGSILGSMNALDWQDQSLLTPGNVSSVAFARGRFLILIQEKEFGPALLTSSNAIDWIATSLPRLYAIDRLHTANDRFIASGRDALDNLVLGVSDDGGSWIQTSTDLPAVNPRVAYGAGRYLVLTDSKVLLSTNGTDWMQGPQLYGARDLCFGAGSFMAVGNLGAIWTSADGLAWVPRFSGTRKDFFVAGFTGQRFIAAGEDGKIVTSPNGSVWMSVTSNVSEELSAFAASPDRVALFGRKGVIVTSPDSQTWTPHWTRPAADLSGVIFTNDIFTAVGDSGTILSSTDGRDWVTRNSGTGQDLHALAHGPAGYVAVGKNGTILNSTNALTWIARPSGTTNTLNHVAYENGLHLAVGTAGAIVTSADGSHWSAQVVSPPGLDGYLDGVAWSRGLYVAVGGYDTTNQRAHSLIVTSPDGVNWTVQPVDFGKKLRHIRSINGEFYALGNDGLVIRSEDAFLWRQQLIAGPLENLRALPSLPGLLAIVGNDGIVFSSSDGESWRRHRLFTSQNLHAAAYGRGVFVAVGTDGTILRAEGILPALSTTPLPAGGGFKFSLMNGARDHYRLQTSHDLFSWRELHLLTNGLPPITDTSLTNPCCFFRLQPP